MACSTAATWPELMADGRFADAWRLSDAALSDPEARDFTRPRHEQRIWTGAALDGQRVLVRCYHGLGDTIQFIRYLPLVKQVASYVAVWAQPALLPLLAPMPSIDALRPLHDGAVDLDFDVDVELMELPHVFRSTLETLPAAVPYLRVPRLSRPRAAIPGRRQVGLAWRTGGWDPRRAIPFPDLSPLRDVRGVDFHALQETLTDTEAPAFPGWRRESIVDVAARIAGLDLVITVDTMFAHLAGALGMPTWLLLHAAPDWRWMRNRCDSPWYPTMRLYRQVHPGDWQAPIAQVQRDLVALARPAPWQT